jgi:hypothetical protein
MEREPAPAGDVKARFHAADGFTPSDGNHHNFRHFPRLTAR